MKTGLFSFELRRPGIRQVIKFILKNRLAVFVYFQYWMFYFSVLHSDGSPLMSAGSGMVDFVVSDRRVFFISYFFIMRFLHKVSWSIDFFQGNSKIKDMANNPGFLTSITHVYFSLHLASHPDL